MFVSVSDLARKAAFVGVCLLATTIVTGCQGAQATPTAQPTATPANTQSTGQFFGGQLPAGLPQDPAAGFGSVEIIQGTTITLTAGRGGFGGGQAPDSQTPRARAQDAQTPRAQGQTGQGGQPQDGQGQRGQGGQFQGGQGQGLYGAGSASVVSLSPDTKYFKTVAAAPSGTPGAQGANPPAVQPRGTPQPGGGPQDSAPQGPNATPPGGRQQFDRQAVMAVEPATSADLQVGSLVMVWGSVIDGRIYADVVYIMGGGPRG
jgi:hypothetical protein